MKNYKWIVPILLVLLFVGSIYSILDTKIGEKKEYKQCVKAAREYAALDIQVDAQACYDRALQIEPSLALSLEIGQYYKDTFQERMSRTWAEQIVTDYPKEAEAYEFLMELYIENQDYISCFQLSDKMQKRKISSPKLEKQIAGIQNRFYLNGSFENVGVYSQGLCPVENRGVWGYVTASGKKAFENGYLQAGNFSDKLAPVVDGSGKTFFIDPQGNKKRVVVGVDNVKSLGIMTDGMFALYNGENWSFYDDNYKYQFGKYEQTSSLANGVAAVKKNHRWYLVNRKGKNLTGAWYDGIVTDEKQTVYRNERCFVYKNIGYYLVDEKGKAVTKQKYQGAKLFNDDTYAAVKIKDKWGFVDKDGKMVIQPTYEDARSFSDGYAAVCQAGKWGFIDMQGKMVISPQFEDTKDFNEQGCVFVKLDGMWQLLIMYKYNH